VTDGTDTVYVKFYKFKNTILIIFASICDNLKFSDTSVYRNTTLCLCLHL